MFQESEIVNLLVGFGSVPVLIVLARRVALPRAGIVYAAFAALLLAYVFTVVEGVVWRQGFNFLEHLAYAAAGLLFLAYVFLLGRSPAGNGNGP
jgi:hypothetical protein